jgi:glycosyltransferase involved in cell wall biosynthesis
MARGPGWAGTLARATRMRGRLATALRMRELVALRHTQTQELLAAADHIVAPAEWVARLLHRLGVPATRVTLSRQGIAATARPPRSMRTSGPLKLVFVGRIEPAKGVHLLTRALRSLGESRIELHVYGITQGDAHARYRADLRAAAARDPRIVLHDPLAPDAVVPTIARYDVLCVPSQQMETGPLVVLEAFAAGLPVIGSRLGGIAELVHHGHDGLLVEGRGMLGWTAALERLLRDPDLLPRLQQGVRAPRTMAAVADDMAEVYRKAAG